MRQARNGNTAASAQPDASGIAKQPAISTQTLQKRGEEARFHWLKISRNIDTAAQIAPQTNRIEAYTIAGVSDQYAGSKLASATLQHNAFILSFLSCVICSV